MGRSKSRPVAPWAYQPYWLSLSESVSGVWAGSGRRASPHPTRPPSDTCTTLEIRIDDAEDDLTTRGGICCCFGKRRALEKN